MRAAMPVLVLSLGLFACGGGGSSSGGGATSTTGTTGTTGNAVTGPFGVASNEPQWQTALAALAQAGAGDPVTFQTPALGAFNDLIARGWPHLVPDVQSALAGIAQGFVGQGGSGITIQGLRNLVLDIGTAPSMTATGAHPNETVFVHAPAAPASWGLSFTADIGGTIHTQVFGQWVATPISGAVDVTVSDIRITQPAVFDMTNPANVMLTSAGTPQIQLTLTLDSPTIIVSQVAPVLTQILDPLVRSALVVGAVYAQQQVGLLLAGFPQGPPWGLGSPAVTPHPAARPLDVVAEEVSVELQSHHLPFGTLFPTVFDTPVQGGNVVGWHHHGDSITWTGNYVAAEAYRYEVTGDPRAKAGLERGIEGIYRCLHITPAPLEGLLSRCAVPVHSPHINAINQKSVYYEVQVDGLTYGGLGNVSRDAYTGVFNGLGRTLHHVPELRDVCRPLVTRALEHLE
ncbi:MAG: hypothetical protein ACYS22_04470, partial [Planctomycetota bacterium]